MGEINKVLGASGAGLTVGGKWTLSPLTKGAQAAFEEWLEGRARRHVAAFQGTLSAEAFAAMVDRLGDRIDAGEYSFGGEKCKEALGTPAGAVEMIRLLLQPTHPGATADDAYAVMTECSGELAAVFRQLNGKKADADGGVKKKAGQV